MAKKELDLNVYDNARQQVLSEKPTYSGTYEQQVQDIYNKIQNREPFKYDVNADPLYQQYKDQYIQGGKLAMKDTMGQAAALTGGYGSTYGQQVGQQAYDAYLQKLTNTIPELYSQAYNKYANEGNQLMQQYSMLGDLRDAEYNRYRNELADWTNERNFQYQQSQDAWNRQMTEDQWKYQQNQDAWNRQMTEDQWKYQQSQDAWSRQMQEGQYDWQKQQQAYSNLYNAILNLGYQPTDAELAAAGMTRAEANAAKAMWDRMYPEAAAGGGGSSTGGNPPPDGGDKTAYQMGVDIAKAYGSNAAAAYATQDKTGLTTAQKKSIYQGIVDTQKLAFLDK